MSDIKYVPSMVDATRNWDNVTAFKSRGKEAPKTIKGQHYTIIRKEERQVSPLERKMYKFFDKIAFGQLSARNVNVKNIITKGKETIRFAVPTSKLVDSTATSKLMPEVVQSNLDAQKKIDSLFNETKTDITQLLQQKADAEAKITRFKNVIVGQQKIIKLQNDQASQGIPRDEEIVKKAQARITSSNIMISRAENSIMSINRSIAEKRQVLLDEIKKAGSSLSDEEYKATLQDTYSIMIDNFTQLQYIAIKNIVA